MKHLITALAVGLTLVTVPYAAFAHKSLSKSNIEAGSTVTELPVKLELTFAKPVGLAHVEFVKPDSNESFDIKLPRKMIKTHSIELPDLPMGAYVIKWRAVAQDGHVLNGEIAFTLAGS